MWKRFLDLLFPTKCIICDSYRDESEVCSACWSKLTFITRPFCAICSNPFEYEAEAMAICGHCVMEKPKYDRAIALFKYDDHSKKIIHRFKYQDQLHILDYFVKLMINMGRDFMEEADIVAPVAMHKYKLLKRGFNQAALLSMRIASKANLEYCPQLLIKVNNVKAQADLTRKQRLKNVKNSFMVNPEFIGKIKGRKILLIDDVITTGATIAECCRVLRKEKPAKIFVLTIAKRV